MSSDPTNGGGTNGTKGANGGAVDVAPPAPGLEFVVEFGDAQNCSFRWPVDERTIRGRWAKANLAKTDFKDVFGNMPDLPGIRLMVDVARRTAEFRDPLAAPGNVRLLEKAQAAYLAAFKERAIPEPPKVYINLTDDDLKNWCYWVRRFLDNGQCWEKVGKVPTMAAVRKMKGRITIQNFNLGTETAKQQVDVSAKYIPLQQQQVVEEFDS